MLPYVHTLAVRYLKRKYEPAVAFSAKNKLLDGNLDNKPNTLHNNILITLITTISLIILIALIASTSLLNLIALEPSSSS